MDENGYLANQNTGQHCGLCFHWIDDALCAEQLVDIFDFNERLNSTLADKIQECLGLYIDTDGTACNICLNCVHTINLIDEFRSLCHQTGKIHSPLLRFNDVLGWERYNIHVSELQTLVRRQRDWVESLLDEANVTDSTSVHVDVENGDTLFTDYIKVEDAVVNEQPEYIKGESRLVENIVDSNKPLLETIENSESVEPTIISSRDSKNQFKLKIAHELQAQASDKPDFQAVSEKLKVELRTLKQTWNEMKNLYKRYKKRAYEGHESSILSCRKCPLFMAMNILVPKFCGDEPYAEPKDVLPEVSERKKAFALQVAIAEEVKAHPELWDLSLDSSAHTMNNAWKEIAQNFEMDMRTLREHWHRLRSLYRMHKARELKGGKKRRPVHEKYDYLVSLLHETIGSSVNVGSAEQADTAEKEVEQTVEENDYVFYQQEHQLALVQEVRKFPIIWYYKHSDFHNIEMQNKTWMKIAESLDKDCESVKRDWKRLRDIFRNRYLRLRKGQVQSDDPLVATPLYEVLNGMFQENMRIVSKDERFINKNCVNSEPDDVEDSDMEEEDPDKKFNEKTKFEFAKVCYDTDIIWNTNHPDYNVQNKQNEAWDLIALQFGVSLEKVQFEWKILRNTYRRRCLCVQKGSTKKTDKLLKTPLHTLMKSMFEEYMRSTGVTPKRHKNESEVTQVDTVDQQPFITSEEQIKLVQEISMHDILWKAKHPNYKKSALHEPLFAEIAAKFGHTSSIIKEGWKKLRRMHLYRQRRIAKGLVDRIQDDVDPLYALLDKLLPSRVTATGDFDPMHEKKNTKCRFTTQRKFSLDGSMPVEVNGEMRYFKVCELCGKQVERSRFEYHMNAHNGLRPYACSFDGCGKQYSSKIQRDRHELEVHDENGYIFQCDQCDAKFKQKAKYEYHYAIKHKSEEVSCDICGKLLKHKKLLSKHKQLHMVNYECHVCGKVLQKKYSLYVHMRVHTKEKPFSCDLCEQRFVLKVQMKNHLLQAHGVGQVASSGSGE